jgi:hypothetical protein
MTKPYEARDETVRACFSSFQPKPKSSEQENIKAVARLAQEFLEKILKDRK